MRDRRRGHVGPRDRRDGRHPRGRRRRRAPVFRVREVRPHSRRPALAARPRRQLLRQARAGRAGRRRLGGQHQALGRGRHRGRFRARIAAARLRPLRAPGHGGLRAHSGARRDRHPADDQRADPDHRRRRAGDRPVARARQLLPLLRLHLGHRRLGRRRLGDGQLDRRRRPGPGPVAVRRAPLRRAAFGQGHAVPAGGGELCPLLPHRVAEPRDRGRPRRAAQPAVRHADAQRRGLRQQVRLGAPELVRAGGHAGAGHADLRARPGLRGHRGRAPRGARARGADRHELVLQVRDPRPGRARPAAKARRQRPRQARRQHRLHAAVQRARRHRGRRDHHAPGRRPLLLRHRQRARRARPLDDRAPPAGRRQRPDHRSHLGQGSAQPVRPEVARGAGATDRRAAGQRQPSRT